MAIQSILELPPELCLDIIQRLDRSALLHICQWSFDNMSRDFVIASLVRSVLHRHELGTYIRHIQLVNEVVNKATTIEVRLQPEIDAAESFIETTKVDYRKDWLRGLQEGESDAFLAVLLFQPLHLDYLEIDLGIFRYCRLTYQVFESMLLKNKDCGLGPGLKRVESPIINAVAPVRKTLRKLHIKIDKLPKLVSDIDIQGSWRGLTEFGLTKITLPFIFLLHMIRQMEHLPATLEKLKIDCDVYQHDKHIGLLKAWLFTLRGSTPQLRQVRFLFSSAKHHVLTLSEREFRAELEKVCNINGILLKVEFRLCISSGII
ncbi:hypothetical protein PISL3812_10054 [Talaromyces islandicus]|uniref:F-box domain-containing protein n=1 Tax=Talaromyces islandicus TaxID=28573 RepID=A0A0U1MBG8_TALIS|nr:hypothetical protein PISL3812_10054 [Talaromyces islandicus]